MSLDRRNHAGHHILAPSSVNRFGLDARPGTGGEFAQQLAIETCVNSQTLGDGKNHLSVPDGKTNIFGDVDACQQRPFLVAGWAGGHRRAAMVGCLQEKATNIYTY